MIAWNPTENFCTYGSVASGSLMRPNVAGGQRREIERRRRGQRIDAVTELGSWPTPTSVFVSLQRREDLGPLCDSENSVRFWNSWS